VSVWTAEPRLVRARVTSPAPRDVWREVLAADPDALATQSPEWVDALCASGYEDASRLYELPRGPRLVLPLVRRAGPWPQALAPRASMPAAWGTGGVAASERPTAADLAAVADDLCADRAMLTGVRPNPLHAELWEHALAGRAAVLPRLAHVLDLEGGRDALWRGGFRRKVRKAERAGLDVEVDATGRLVGVFYELYEISVKRWADQQHEPLTLARWRAHRRDPLEKFERMAAALGPAMRVWVAWKDGAPLSSMIVLQGANAQRTRSAMNKELSAPTNAGHLLEWLAIQDAAAAGCRYYHLGESGESRSLARYKEDFGARPVRYAEYRIERLPLTQADRLARSAVKRGLRFKDVG